MTAALSVAATTDAEPAPDAERVVSGHTAAFSQPPRAVPTDKTPDGPLLGNGDVGVVNAGPPERQRFHIGKNDFWSRHCIVTVGGVALEIPGLAGASYRQEQDLYNAEVRGAFVK
jgi:alpha-L-fucosidase 2